MPFYPVVLGRSRPRLAASPEGEAALLILCILFRPASVHDICVERHHGGPRLSIRTSICRWVK